MEPFKTPYFDSPFYAVYNINNTMEKEIYSIIDTKVSFGVRLTVLDNVRFMLSRTHDSIHNSVSASIQKADEIIYTTR